MSPSHHTITLASQHLSFLADILSPEHTSEALLFPEGFVCAAYLEEGLFTVAE